MATGHILPGYGNPVTRLRRATTAYPMDKHKLKEITERITHPMDPRTLASIRQNARNAWSNYTIDREPTTYGYFHSEVRLDEPTQSRPTELARRHKPHPKPVFLTNRLHYIQGYHNADATMGKECYRTDASVPEEERQWRLQAREKYIPRPRSAAIDQYDDPYAPLTEALDPVEAWGAQAFLKVADDDHKHEVLHAVNDYKDKQMFPSSKPQVPGSQYVSPRPYTAIPSTHRWMKFAGARESDIIHRRIADGYPPSTIQPMGSLGYPETTTLRKQQEMNAVRNARYVHKPIRGDFLIHPEWPPTFPHHKID